MHEFFYKVNDKEYRVVVTYKKIKNIYYRFCDGIFKISCSKRISDAQIKRGLDKYGKTLIKRTGVNKGEDSDYVFIFGVKVPISDQGEINFTDGSTLTYKSREDLEKKLKKMLLEYLKSSVEYYSYQMNVPLYKVRVKKMRTRFGSNSKQTSSLSFAYDLIHFAHPTIESVVVHELAHILVYDHSKKFYNVVYQYCPEYDKYRKKLIKRDFS